MQSEPNLIDEIRYEFNRLFVGPKRPKAEPYESVYFDYQTMFGAKTMQVRSFYESSRLKLEDAQLDKFPDDFIGYELQYLYFLSFSALKAEDEHANLDVWKSFGSFLNLYLNSEMDALKSALKDPEIFKNLKE